MTCVCVLVCVHMCVCVCVRMCAFACACATHVVTCGVAEGVALATGVLLALLGAEPSLDRLKQHGVQVPVLPRRHLDDWDARGRGT